MGIKTFRPKTHSLRFKTVIDYKQEITTEEPEYYLRVRNSHLQRPMERLTILITLDFLSIENPVCVSKGSSTQKDLL